MADYNDVFINFDKVLTPAEIQNLEKQNTRLVSEFHANKLELEAKKNWDLFYKRNETRFFKDRHWTVREFHELINDSSKKILLEIGCGVGNLIYPLIEDNTNFYIYACDLSSRAIEFIKGHSLYDEKRIHAFQTDVTTDHIFSVIKENSIDVITLVFVLSAIHPLKFGACIGRFFKLLKPGGVVLFRDYALHDLAQIRFKPGHKIAENFYMRQDGTRSYYFNQQQLNEFFEKEGFNTITISYIQRTTVNKKEGLNAARLFLQGKFRKPDRLNDSIPVQESNTLPNLETPI